MKHVCSRCGFESGHDSWIDRHPWPTVAAGIPLAIFGVGAVLAYPWILLPLLLVTGLVWLDWRQKQRQAITARADWDYRQQMAAMTWNGHGEGSR